MRLRDDLKVLAHAAPPPPAPDELMVKAQAIRQRRAAIAPAVAVVAVLVLTITYLSRVDGADPAMMLSFRLERPSESGTVQPPTLDKEMARTRDILRERAKFVGLKHPRTRLIDSEAILLEYAGGDGGIDFQRLAAPGHVQMRKVLVTVDRPAEDFTTPTPSPQTAAGKEVSTLDDLIGKLGPEIYSRALALRDVGEARLLPGFDTLTEREVALLPTSIQLYVPTISCARLVNRFPPPGVPIVSCDGDNIKLLLDKAALTGADVEDAMPVEDQGWHEVRLSLTQVGQLKFANVSSQAAAGQGCQPASPAGHCRLAMMVDGEVLSVPEVLRVLSRGEAVLGARPSEAQARMVAATLGPRELPPGIRLTYR